MNYVFHIVVVVCIYVMLGQSMNIIMGYSGLISLCHAGFYASGAYVSTLLMIDAGWPFLPSFILAVIVTGALAWILSHVVVRFHGDSFVLATLSVQMILSTVLYNWTGLTRGPLGISRIPRPSCCDLRIEAPWEYALFAIGMSTVVLVMIRRLVTSPYGRTLQAVRDDDVAACSLAKSVVYFRRSAFIVSGVLASIPGVLFASYMSYIDPTSFTVDESIFIVCVVVVGGTGNIRGPVIGAVTLVLLPEVLRFIHVPDSVAASVRQVIYGLLIILLMRIRPKGIAGQYAFD